ncbi:hypothetical protein BZM27_25705, partial [Paraburkholderia steynii]
GRRVKLDNKSRMPAQTQAKQPGRATKSKRGHQRKSESESKSKSKSNSNSNSNSNSKSKNKNKNQQIAPLSEPPAYVYNP